MDFSAVGSFFALVGIAIASLFTPSVTINYEVAVTITRDGQPYTGRGVWSMRSEEVQAIGYRHIVPTVRGEAIEIPVPDGPQVYALRRGQFSTQHYGGFPDHCVPADRRGSLLAAIEKFGGPCEVKKELPQLVTVGDPSDPATIEPVGILGRPQHTDTCSTRICLVRVVVTRTSAAITTGILENMPWLAMGRASSEIGTGDNKSVRVSPGKLYNQDFSTEIEWRN